MKRQYEEVVANGVKFLEQQFPDWRSKINQRTLNMQHCNRCILGQVQGNYWKVLGVLFTEKHEADKFAISHGFLLSDKDDEDNNWSELANEWRYQLTEEQPLPSFLPTTATLELPVTYSSPGLITATLPSAMCPAATTV